jgi:hypothetical protein
MNKSKTIRNILLCFLVSFSFIPASSGQAALIILILGDKVATENFHLSVDGALNLSNFAGVDDDKIAAGVNFGLGTHIKLGEKWHLKPEIKLLSRKGVRDVSSITDVPTDFVIDLNKLKLYYIDLPVFLQYNFTPKFFISAGPQVSFLTNAYQYSIGTLSDGTESTIRINSKSYFNGINFSFPVEAGYLLKLANKRSTTTMDINVYVRYEYGFMDIFKDPADGSARISLFQVGLSLPFIKSEEELAQTKK